MAKHAIIKFPAGNVTVKLLKSPATDIWLEQLGIWKDENIPMATQRGLMLHHGWEGYKRRNPRLEREYVDQINRAIADANKLLQEGSQPFPYEAWVDMPWQQTNLIHRSFTLGLTSRETFPDNPDPGGIWRHSLTNEELLNYTKTFCYDDRHYVKRNSQGIQQFRYKLVDHFNMNECLERINKYVHLYENIRYSERSGIFHEKEAPKYLEENNLGGHGPIEINLTWDNYDSSGGRKFQSIAQPGSDVYLNSIPENWMNFDVFLIKSITGKDYETAFQNYDNPLDYDTQNVQDITGGLRIFPNQGHKMLYGDSNFGTWIRSYGIDYKNYAPVPVGKIISADFDLTLIDSVPDSFNSDGSCACQPEYRNPIIEVVEVDEPEQTTYPEEIIQDTNNFI